MKHREDEQSTTKLLYVAFAACLTSSAYNKRGIRLIRAR